MTTVTVEDPRQPEIEAMLRAGDAYALSLYPADSCYMLDLDELTAEGVTVFVARDGAGTATGMAALVNRGDATGELKRLFVAENGRGQGVATAVMDALEAAARAQSIHTLQLETGPKQLAAIALYERRGYHHIENFGPYVGDEFSVCMEKPLT
ncbi:GNAT family N-acetyltransferase [Microcella humidisoli]|uniref:GNAT family N-acetyltransferase n=1 Tax=Microcella humidisoli TaxID=2963406 RepID=A0ABY5FYE9_9MICO|nr:GNAT family N-acetyltransferase [Microcella humidisoli]UTT63340.1 GNAT family N-acetyltransferase [Microcella humidisoli]